MRKVKLIIADDSVEVRVNICNLLFRIKNIEIIGGAEDSVQAYSLLTYQPDIAIVDINLPGIANGMDLIFAGKMFYPNIEYIVLYNYWEPQFRQECTKAGVKYFFEKNHELHKIFEAVNSIIQKHPEASLTS